MMKKLSKKNRTFMIILLIIWINAVAAVIYFSVTAPTSGQIRKIPVYSVETEEKQVALTFNCAWDDTGLDTLLDILKEYDAKCTFFVVGDFAEKYPDAVRRIHNAGHEIANHSMKHNDPVKQNYEDIITDITACNDVLYSVTGKRPHLYRAPSGSYDNKTVEAAENLGMRAIQWSADSIDWKDPSPDEIIRRILKKADNGMIALFHAGKENTVTAVPAVLSALTDKGFSFVTVSELLPDSTGYIDINGRFFAEKGDE